MRIYPTYDEPRPSELEIDLAHLIRQTRMEGEGMPLKRVAEIITEHLDESEARALAKYITARLATKQ